MPEASHRAAERLPDRLPPRPVALPPRRVPATWDEPDDLGLPVSRELLPVSQRRHQYGWGAVDIERRDHAQPLRTYATPEKRERAANWLLAGRVSLAGLGWLAVALVLVGAVLVGVAAVLLGVEVVQWAKGVEL